MKKKIASIAGIWLGFIIFVLPQSFGMAIDSNGISIFSLNLTDWILNPEVNQWLLQPWPVMMMPVFCPRSLLFEESGIWAEFSLAYDQHVKLFVSGYDSSGQSPGPS